MKRIIFAILLMTPACAIATEKCTTLDPSGSVLCSSNQDDYEDKADWEATCPSSNGIPVRGISACAETYGTWGSSEVTVRDNLEFSADTSENINCWCKMVSPAVSRWVFRNAVYNSASDCAALCAVDCVTITNRAPAAHRLFWQMLFSNLKD